MALTHDQTLTPDAAPATSGAEPTIETPRPSWRAWLGLGLSVLAVAALIAVVAVGPGRGGDETPANHRQVAENGSPRAVDAAAAGAPAPNHGELVERGSVVAADQASTAGPAIGPPQSENHGSIADRGSIRAVEHATATSGS